MKTINERMKFICDIYANGNIADFARIMKWSYQYAYKTLTDKSVGIVPVTEVLRKFPQVNARWLLLEDGAPLTNLMQKQKSRLELMLEYEKYLKFMTPEQIKKYAHNIEEFTQEEVAELDVMWWKAEKELNDLFAKAMARRRK